MTSRELGVLPPGRASLEGKVAIVTGASQGLGRDISLALARAGALVTVAARNVEKLESVACELGEYGQEGLAVECDVSRRQDAARVVEQTVAERGGVDILINNAHDLSDLYAPFVDTTENDLMRSLGSGLFGSYYFLRECYPYLKEQRGKVVNMGSAAGVMGMANLLSYAVAKEAIRAMTRVVAREWGPDGINVNTVCPYSPDTPDMARSLAAMSDEEREQARRVRPLERFGTGAETASVVLFLASDAASFITGHTLMVDGGFTMDAGR